MPSYRSSDEAEIRDAVVSQLRRIRPDARIIHEINVAGTGSNRIDIIAVDHAEIIAVEVKSKKDTLTRLPAQITAMKNVAHHVIIAVHEKFLVRDMVFPNHERFHIPGIKEYGPFRPWIYPEIRTRPGYGWSENGSWRHPDAVTTTALPDGALAMLWADELRNLCAELTGNGRKNNMLPPALPCTRSTPLLCSRLNI